MEVNTRPRAKRVTSMRPWWIGRGVGRFRLDIEDFQIPSDQATDYLDNPSMKAAFSSNLSCSKWVSI